MISLLKFSAFLFIFVSFLKFLIIAGDRSDDPFVNGCGGTLADILANVCLTRGIVTMNKRAPINRRIENEEPDYYNYDSLADYGMDSNFVYRRRRSIPRRIQAVKIKRSSSRIVDECCKKSCTIDELKEYCPSYLSMKLWDLIGQ